MPFLLGQRQKNVHRCCLSPDLLFIKKSIEKWPDARVHKPYPKGFASGHVPYRGKRLSGEVPEKWV
jgi:hypothetical protein